MTFVCGDCKCTDDDDDEHVNALPSAHMINVLQYVEVFMNFKRLLATLNGGTENPLPHELVVWMDGLLDNSANTMSINQMIEHTAKIRRSIITTDGNEYDEVGV